MVSKIQALRDECFEILKSKNDFEDFQNNISFEELDKAELKQFIKLCNNRIEYSKTFLNVTIWIIGFILTALLISFSISFGKDISNLEEKTTIIISFILLVFGLIASARYRNHTSHISAWTAFKEMALMYCPEK